MKSLIQFLGESHDIRMARQIKGKLKVSFGTVETVSSTTSKGIYKSKDSRKRKAK